MFARVARVCRQVADWDFRLTCDIQDNEFVRAQAEEDVTQAPVVVEASEIGQTSGARCIYMIKVSSPAPQTQKRKLVFVVTGQHGDEPAGPEAVLTLIEHFASSVDAAVEAPLRNVDLVIVPVANPDGLAVGTRRTGRGIDLNRDWIARDSEEARAIWSQIAQLRPDALMDLHEDTPVDRAGTYARVSCGSSASRAALTKSFADHGYRVNVSPSRTSGTLLHPTFARTFAKPAYLVETKYTSYPDSGLRKRADMHLTAVMSVVKRLASESDPGLVPSQDLLDTNLACEVMQFSREGNIAAIEAAIARDTTLITRRDPNGATLLHYVVQGGSAEAIGELISQNADVNARNGNGVTPLHIAAAFGHSEVAAVLLAAGADPDAKDSKGRTPGDIARERGQKAIVELLNKTNNQLATK